MIGAPTNQTVRRIRLPLPHAGQRVILQNGARRKFVAAGRRWRKTTMALHPALADSLQGKSILWGAPTIEQSRVGWDELKRAAGGVYDFAEARREATSPAGGRIIFKTLDDPDSARGFTFDGAVFDEASLIKQAAYYEVVEPILADTAGWLLALYTPKGRNWIWREAMQAAERADSAAWQVPTLGVRIVFDSLIRAPHPLENPNFSFDEAVRLFQTLPRKTFEQEFLAQYVDDAGGVFRNIRANATAQRSTPDEHENHHIVIGVDWAQQHDFTVLTCLCATCKREVDKDRFNQVSWNLQRARLSAMAERWRPARILAESNSIGSPNIEELMKEDLPIAAFETTATSKPPLIQSLILAFEKNEITILNDTQTINELEAFEEKRSATTGRPQFGAPQGLHDDCVISLALAWRAAEYHPLLMFGYNA